MRDITMTERHTTAAATARMFPEPRWSYLRSALQAAVTLTNADEDYLGRMDNRAYQARVLATNLALYRAARKSTR
jgi:hypothetical protein